MSFILFILRKNFHSALRCSYMSTNLRLQTTNNAFLQSENHVNHYHHLHNVTFPHRHPDCRVDVCHCETNILVTVCVGRRRINSVFTFYRKCGWFSTSGPFLHSVTQSVVQYNTESCCELLSCFSSTHQYLFVFCKNCGRFSQCGCCSHSLHFILPINYSLDFFFWVTDGQNGFQSEVWNPSNLLTQNYWADFKCLWKLMSCRPQPYFSNIFHFYFFNLILRTTHQGPARCS